MSQIFINDFKSKNFINYVWMKNSFFAEKNREFLDICKNYLSSLGDLNL